MSKFYKDPRFIELKIEWQFKLKESGFIDVEDHRERLRQYDRRTIGWENRDRIRDFFIRLEQFLEENDVKEVERNILTLYIQGAPLREIAVRLGLGLGRTKVKDTIRKYKRLLT